MYILRDLDNTKIFLYKLFVRYLIVKPACVNAAKETRTRARDVPTTCYEISLINARNFTHNQCLSKGLKKIEEKSSCEIQVSNAN